MKDIQQLFQEFMWECEFSRKLRPETLKGYRDMFGTFNKLVPDLQLTEINTVTVTKFFKNIEERKRIVGKGMIRIGVKKSTIVTYWSKLRCFFEWLETRGHISTNPFKLMRRPSPVYEERQFLKKEEVEKIFTAVYLHHNNNLLILKRNILIFTILLFCGLRKEELMLLQIRDLDLERKLLTVRSETSKGGNTRRIPLTSQLAIVLKDYLQERKKYTTPYLLVSSTGDKQLSYDGLKHLVTKLNRTSKVRFHLHQFRHTFAINFLKQSHNVFKLKELLGHKDIKMTAVYLRCLPVEEMREDVEKMSIDSLI
ncbi:MAG TPA: site-specific integrase [Mucilaginibacter sp.]|jgi:site-specific recombinase XerD